MTTLTRTRQGIERRVERSGAARRALAEIVAALRNVRNDPVPRFSVVVGQRGRGRSGDQIDLLMVSDRTARPDSPESDQYEMSFYLTKRKGRPWPSLVSRQDPALDEHPERGGVETLIAEGIVELRFAYYSRREWHEEWSDPESPPPEAVRVTVSAVERDPPDAGRRPVVTTLSTIVAIRKPRAPQGANEGTERGAAR